MSRKRNTTRADDAPMTDATALGERCYKKMTAAWIDAASVVFELDGDKAALKEFRVAFGRNPAHIKKAVERFPQYWDPDNDADLFTLLATIHLSKIADDNHALALYEQWVDDVNLDYDALKRMVKEHNAKPAKPKTAQPCERCERVDDALITLKMDMDNLISNSALLFWKHEPGQPVSTDQKEYYPVDFRKLIEHYTELRAILDESDGEEMEACINGIRAAVSVTP